MCVCVGVCVAHSDSVHPLEGRSSKGTPSVGEFDSRALMDSRMVGYRMVRLGCHVVQY
jgi:hypothetical protein